MKKLAIVVGARPQFIKLAAVVPELNKYFSITIIHTGQHYDESLSGRFFLELNIPSPEFNFEIGSDTALKQIAGMLTKFDDLLPALKPDALMVFGDTNSTAAGAIAAGKHRIPLIHVEAGMREFNKWIPEESNKLITTVLSDYHFCATPTAVNNLANMGIRHRVWHIGDVMIDLLYRHKDAIHDRFSILKQKFKVQTGGYTFVTMHRDANKSSLQRMDALFDALNKISGPIIFSIHPGTLARLQKSGRMQTLVESSIRVCEPLPYIDTQALIKNAAQVITDSGGITKEAWVHGIRAIIFESQTEWIESLEGHANILATSEKEILAAMQIPYPSTGAASILGNGNASAKLAAILHQELTV